MRLGETQGNATAIGCRDFTELLRPDLALVDTSATDGAVPANHGQDRLSIARDWFD